MNLPLLRYEDYPLGSLLLCPLCEKPIEKGEWFVLASQAVETVRTGTPTQSAEGIFVPQRGVHLLCLGGR